MLSHHTSYITLSSITSAMHNITNSFLLLSSLYLLSFSFSSPLLLFCSSPSFIFFSFFLQQREAAKDTIFGKIVRGEIPCKKIHEGIIPSFSFGRGREEQGRGRGGRGEGGEREGRGRGGGGGERGGIERKEMRKRISTYCFVSDALSLAFHDIEPKAPVHFLVIPKDPIAGLSGMEGRGERKGGEEREREREERRIDGDQEMKEGRKKGQKRGREGRRRNGHPSTHD